MKTEQPTPHTAPSTRARTPAQLAVLAFALLFTGCAVEAVTVQAPDGPIEGVADGETQTFLGIPFAKPPLGPLRFAAPERVAPWTRTLDATVAKPPCAQLGFESQELDKSSSENCLGLNIWAPKRSGRFPVMVWIPGGGYVLGHGAQPAYNGKRLSESRDVVVVTVNYRLGAFGFLSHASLREAEGATGNFGLLDQREALRWVQRNIEAFHGDPNAVTIFGESAGGGSVCMHMVSKGSAGLFQRAIVESGPCTSFDMPTREVSEAQGAKLADALQCSGSPQAIVACLRAAPTLDVLRALPPNEHLIYGDGVSWFPSVDGSFLEDQPATLLARGAAGKVPLIVGANADEASTFYAAENIGSEAEALAILSELLDADDARSALDHYDEATLKDELMRIVSDAYICDARRVAALHTQAGGTAYQYHFTHGFKAPFIGFGAYHAAEIAFVFGNDLGLRILPFGSPLEAAMQGYWSAFARAGDPNRSGLPDWQPYTPTRDNSMRLDLTVEEISKVRKEACDFWDTRRGGVSK